MLHPVMVLGAVVEKSIPSWGLALGSRSFCLYSPWQALQASRSLHAEQGQWASLCYVSVRLMTLCDVCVRSGGKASTQSCAVFILHFTLVLQNLKSNSNPCMKEKKCCFQVSMCSPQYFFKVSGISELRYRSALARQWHMARSKPIHWGQLWKLV